MKIAFYLMALLSFSAAQSMTQKIEENDEVFASLKNAIHFATTDSYDEVGPDVTAFTKAGRTFFAKIDRFGSETWVAFKDNNGASKLQENCSNGGSWGINWYYMDDSSETKSDDHSQEAGELSTSTGPDINTLRKFEEDSEEAVLGQHKGPSEKKSAAATYFLLRWCSIL